MTKQEQEDLKKEIHSVLKNKNNLEVKMFITMENFINKRYKAINYTRCCKSDSELLCHLCNKPLKEGVSLDYCTNLYCVKERA